jgi:hypothetical protein
MERTTAVTQLHCASEVDHRRHPARHESDRGVADRMRATIVQVLQV